MKRFLLKFALFILPILLGLFVLDYTVTQGLKKTRYEYFAEWNDIFEGRANSDLIINGSSRAWVHISPKIIEDKTNCSSYNLGMDGQTFYMQYYHYLTYEKYNKKPKYIIQTLRESSLSKGENLTNYEQFLPYLDEDIITSAALTYKGLSKWDGKIPFYRYVGEYNLIRVGILEYFNVESFSNGKYKGYKGFDRPWNGAALEQMKKSGRKAEIKFDADSVKLFESFLKYTRDSNIKLFLVIPPQYIESQSFISNKEQVMNTYKDLAAKYKIPLLDYSDDPMSYKKEFFYNAMHLNKKGAELFTEKLIKDMTDKYGFRPECK
jgi:hypothetical protein